MNRRRCLEWLSGSLAAACSAVLALPGVSYVFATVRRQQPEGSSRRRVTRLRDLPIGRPVNLALTGQRRDAWTTYPDEPIAQLWFLRRDDDSVPPAECRVAAFSSVCPHLRCRVQMDGARQQFLCPCHRGAFNLEGQPLTDEQLGHRNPAQRGLDAFQCRVVPDERGEWWVEVESPG